MMAPSGKFWTAIPTDRAKLPAAVMPASPASQPASTTPTAIPSGILWRMMASTSMVVRFSWVWGPSGWPLLWCRWGMVRSNASRNSTPSQNPITAGRKAHLPSSAACSIAGIRRLQTDAAAITPAANPVRARWSVSPMPRSRKKTQPAPRDVPRKGRNSSPRIRSVMSRTPSNGTVANCLRP